MVTESEKGENFAENITPAFDFLREKTGRTDLFEG